MAAIVGGQFDSKSNHPHSCSIAAGLCVRNPMGNLLRPRKSKLRWMIPSIPRWQAWVTQPHRQSTGVCRGVTLDENSSCFVDSLSLHRISVRGIERESN